MRKSKAAYNLLRMLPKDIQELEGSVDFYDSAYGHGSSLSLSLYGGDQAMLVCETYGFEFGKPELNTYDGTFYRTAEIGRLKVRVSKASGPPDCKVYEVTELQTRYRSTCEDNNEEGS